MANPYLTFASEASFTISIYNATKNWDGTLYYSTDTETWNEWDGTTTLSSAEHDSEQRLYMRGSGNTVITGNSSNYRFVLAGTGIRCEGNVENLLDYETAAAGEHPAMASYCYYCMFYGCTSLTQAPELPATTLAQSCYYSMFYGCISLTQAPELPATTLALSCYYSMFYGCTSLTQAPELPATTLRYGCYSSMFHGCTSLTQAPELPATTLAEYCYTSMFYDCTGIKLSKTKSGIYTYAYRIPYITDGITASNDMNQMFANTGGTFTGTPTINTTYYMVVDGCTVYLAGSDHVVGVVPARACVDCGSTGKVDAKGPECETCSGTGIVDHYESTCSSCGGDGLVTTRVECDECDCTGAVKYTGDTVWYKYTARAGNTHIAPHINAVWTGELKKTYPYIHIAFSSPTGSYNVSGANMYMTKEPWAWNETSSRWECKNGYERYDYSKNSDKWTHIGGSSNDSTRSSFPINWWFSYDVYDSEGTAVNTYTEPVVYTNTVMISCTNCSGDGWVDTPKVTCTVCDGFGYISTKPTTACEECGGDGRVNTIGCATCLKTGVMEDYYIVDTYPLYTFAGHCPQDAEYIRLSNLGTTDNHSEDKITKTLLSSKIEVSRKPTDGEFTLEYSPGSTTNYRLVLWTAYSNENSEYSQTLPVINFNDIEFPVPKYYGQSDSDYPYAVLTAVDDDYVESVGYKYKLYGLQMPLTARLDTTTGDTILGYGTTAYDVYEQTFVGDVWRDMCITTSTDIINSIESRKTSVVWSSHNIAGPDGVYFAGSSYVITTKTSSEPVIVTATQKSKRNPNYNDSCLSADTLITMADGSFKRMDELRVGNMVMSEDGSATEIYRIGRGHHNPYHILYTFDDGTVIDETHDHRFFNVDQGFWQRLKNWEIGERAKCQNGSTVCLASIDRIEEPKEMFGIWTESGSYYANGLLSGVATCNQDLLADATAEMAIDMLLSADEHQLLELLDFGGALP